MSDLGKLLLCTVAWTKQTFPCWYDPPPGLSRSACNPIVFLVVTAGLLANLTCILSELYDMQEAMSLTVNPEWVVPYTTDAEEYQDLHDDFSAYVQASSLAKQPCMCTACAI